VWSANRQTDRQTTLAASVAVGRIFSSRGGWLQVMCFAELRSLYLSLCTQLSDVSLSAVVRGLPSLEQLHAALLPTVTDAGVADIRSVLSL